MIYEYGLHIEIVTDSVLEVFHLESEGNISLYDVMAQIWSVVGIMVFV